MPQRHLVLCLDHNQDILSLPAWSSFNVSFPGTWSSSFACHGQLFPLSLLLTPFLAVSPDCRQDLPMLFCKCHKSEHSVSTTTEGHSSLDTQSNEFTYICSLQVLWGLLKYNSLIIPFSANSPPPPPPRFGLYHVALRIFVPQPGIEFSPSAVKVQSLTTGSPGNSIQLLFAFNIKTRVPSLAIEVAFCPCSLPSSSLHWRLLLPLLSQMVSCHWGSAQAILPVSHGTLVYVPTAFYVSSSVTPQGNLSWCLGRVRLHTESPESCCSLVISVSGLTNICLTLVHSS